MRIRLAKLGVMCVCPNHSGSDQSARFMGAALFKVILKKVQELQKKNHTNFAQFETGRQLPGETELIFNI